MMSHDPLATRRREAEIKAVQRALAETDMPAQKALLITKTKYDALGRTTDTDPYPIVEINPAAHPVESQLLQLLSKMTDAHVHGITSVAAAKRSYAVLFGYDEPLAYLVFTVDGDLIGWGPTIADALIRALDKEIDAVERDRSNALQAIREHLRAVDALRKLL